MVPRNKSGWLYAFPGAERDWTLACGDALGNVLNALDDPDQQYPSIVLCMGGSRKSAVLTSAFACPKPQATRSGCLAELHLDRATTHSKHPLLVADVDVQRQYTVVSSSTHCGGGPKYDVEWPNVSDCDAISLVDTVVSRLILSFVDVVCLYLEDFPTSYQYIELLERWTNEVNLSRPWKPRIILVTQRPRILREIPNIARLGEARHVKASPGSSTLKEAIEQSAHLVRAQRRASKTLFSATHLKALFETALQHTAKFIDVDFDYIKATQQHSITEEQSSYHIKIFLELCLDQEVDRGSLILYIASTLVLDSLPPGMHYFEPRHMFRSLHKAYCYKVLLHGVHADQEHTYKDLCLELEIQFVKLCLQMKRCSFTAREQHEQLLIRLSTIDWTKIQTTRTCLWCLRRCPEHSFHCGHAFCDTCACIFGERTANMEYTYLMTRCILCQQSGEITVRVKPPTAGSRLLVLDGGGIRGAFTLQALKALERERRLPYPLYDEFDLALGTSSGGLIILMFLLRRNIHECVTMFHTLAKRVFARHKQFKGSCFGRIRALLCSLLTDSLYGAAEMEACVEEAYGANARLFGNLGVTASGGAPTNKFAVTSMSVSDSRLCLLSNYNGTGIRRPDCGYKHYRPGNAENEILIRDAARATSAAPSYFPAKFIRGLGYLQDGGAGKHNNPIDPAEWESQAIWSCGPDVAISIGTGYAQEPGTPPIIPQRLRFRDRFFPRLFRLFGAVLNSQDSWNEHLNRVKEDERGKYFRVNIPLEKEIPLDDVGKISHIENLATRHLIAYDFLSIVRALSAVSFFFELHQKPVPVMNRYRCLGSIRSRSPDTTALLNRILEEYPIASFVLNVDSEDPGTNLGSINESNLCATCGHYQKHICFDLCHPHQSFCIYLKFSRLWKHNISGFPQTVSHFVKRQLLDARFGRPDHRSVNYATLGECKCVSTRAGNKRRRRKTLTEAAERLKKQRLAIY